MPKDSVRPLLFRPGAQYTCFGDGLCCTDIHGLGPLTKSELVQIRKIDPEGAHFDDEFDDRMLKPVTDGGCYFLMEDLRCRVHAEHGPEAKPDGCRRFPLGLIATPDGGRVTTMHRCPCRTMGSRPDLTEDAVISSISDSKGKPTADDRVSKVKISRKGKKISWDEWKEIEAKLLSKLADGVAPEKVLAMEPFPKLKKTSWEDQHEELVENARDGSAFGIAAGWFAEIMRSLAEPSYRARPPYVRPWAPAFDRAEKRDGHTRSADEVFADWISDEIWSMKWHDLGGWDVMRADLSTRLAIARAIVERLLAEHDLHPGRAAAEAVMVVELIGESEHWSAIHDAIRV